MQRGNQNFNSLQPNIAEAQNCATQLDEYDLDSQLRASDVGSFGLIRHTGQEQMQEHIPTSQESEMEMGGGDVGCIDSLPDIRGHPASPPIAWVGDSGEVLFGK